MILSASVNTDVPARHGAWFQRRLVAGYLRVAGSDPWKQRKIALDAAHVDGIVFWTRNVHPFLAVLDAVHRRGIPFVIHYALTAAPRSSGEDAIGAMRELGQRFGPRVVVWRYDPLALDDDHAAESHLASFTQRARALEGIVDEAVVAFARPRPRRARARGAATESLEPAALSAASVVSAAHRRDLVRRLADAARESAMRLSVCADADALAPGSSPARCIDGRRLADVGGRPVDAPTAGFLRDCLCARAIDVGDYGGTTPDCFCGADGKRSMRRRHDPQSEFLFEPVKRFASARLTDLPF